MNRQMYRVTQMPLGGNVETSPFTISLHALLADAVETAQRYQRLDDKAGGSGYRYALDTIPVTVTIDQQED